MLEKYFRDFRTLPPKAEFIFNPSPYNEELNIEFTLLLQNVVIYKITKNTSSLMNIFF